MGELPEDKTARVDWVIRAADNAELVRRYDLWASRYDGDLGDVSDYRAPLELAKVAVQRLPLESAILDAGAGTGLSGAALKAAGFRDLVALDFSAQMLARAEAKGIYRALHHVDLSQRTALPDDSADALVTCGTTTQIPPSALQEYVRLVRPEGAILFASVRGAWETSGYAAAAEALGDKLTFEARGAPFQMMPTTEPDFICEILSFRVA